jgi:L-glutamine:scyllo-inosose aminotransferase/L-glutamine:2-deoxy-scyllo-inosose/3-amino-2,3-dideoxy-scyllo-inosose aminotransferase
MSPEAARRAITPHTKAILIVHPFCRLADIDAFVSLAGEYGIPLIEDCSQAHGARWQGRRVGSFGSVGCFSMQQSKVLTAGEGGAAITNDGHLCERMEQLRADGRLFAPEARPGRLELVEIGDVQGQNFCLSEFQAAVLLDRLGHLDEENAVRERAAAALEALIGDVRGVRLLPRQPGASQTYYNVVFDVECDAFAGSSVDAVARALTEELNVLVHPIYKPLNHHPLYVPLRSSRAPKDDALRRRIDPGCFDLPNAVIARARCLSMPHAVLLDPADGPRDIVAAFDKVRSRAADLGRTLQGSSAEAF